MTRRRVVVLLHLSWGDDDGGSVHRSQNVFFRMAASPENNGCSPRNIRRVVRGGSGRRRGDVLNWKRVETASRRLMESVRKRCEARIIDGPPCKNRFFFFLNETCTPFIYVRFNNYVYRRGRNKEGFENDGFAGVECEL